MSKIKIIPLGGVRENGKNMYAVDVDGDIFVLDCGLAYPENELLGIDIVIPDFSYLEENADRIMGVFLTHGHADAIGAVPYFLKKFDVPIFGTELTIELAKITIVEDKALRKYNDFHVIDADMAIDFGKTTISFFKTTHTVPDSVGIVVETPDGQVVYTGDFKFDQSAIPMYQSDYARLAGIGTKGVLALLSDSANAESSLEVSSERQISQHILETIKYHDSRIIVATAASNILRIQQIFNAAYKAGRKVLLTGRDVEKIVKTAIRLNKLTVPSEDLIVPVEQIHKLKPEEVLVLETGKMGEPIKSLQKMATGSHELLNITEGDLVYITTTTSHAMETTVAKTKNMIYRAGGDVLQISSDLRASGHGSQNDLKLMMNLIKPANFIPIQGEFRLLSAHANLANEVGITNRHVYVPSKGDVIEIDHEKMTIGASVEAGNTMIDGIGVGDIGNIVLRDRKTLSEDGIFIAVVTIDRRNKKIISKPQISSKGFVYDKKSKDLLVESAKKVSEVVQHNLDTKEFDWATLKSDVREQLSRYLYDQTKRRPVILPVIMEINNRRR